MIAVSLTLSSYYLSTSTKLVSNGLLGRVTLPHGPGANLAVHPGNRNAFSSLYQLIPLDMLQWAAIGLSKIAIGMYVLLMIVEY